MFDKKDKTTKRFVVKEEQNFGMSAVQVIVDTVTGVNYLTTMTGITPLFDSKGNVIVDKTDK